MGRMPKMTDTLRTCCQTNAGHTHFWLSVSEVLLSLCPLTHCCYFKVRTSERKSKPTTVYFIKCMRRWRTKPPPAWSMGWPAERNPNTTTTFTTAIRGVPGGTTLALSRRIAQTITETAATFVQRKLFPRTESTLAFDEPKRATSKLGKQGKRFRFVVRRNKFLGNVLRIIGRAAKFLECS